MLRLPLTTLVNLDRWWMHLKIVIILPLTKLSIHTEEKPEETEKEEPKKTESLDFDKHLKSLVKEIVRKKLGL